MGSVSTVGAMLRLRLGRPAGCILEGYRHGVPATTRALASTRSPGARCKRFTIAVTNSCYEGAPKMLLPTQRLCATDYLPTDLPTDNCALWYHGILLREPRQYSGLCPRTTVFGATRDVVLARARTQDGNRASEPPRRPRPICESSQSAQTMANRARRGGGPSSSCSVAVTAWCPSLSSQHLSAASARALSLSSPSPRRAQSRSSRMHDSRACGGGVAGSLVCVRRCGVARGRSGAGRADVQFVREPLACRARSASGQETRSGGAATRGEDAMRASACGYKSAWGGGRVGARVRSGLTSIL